MRLGRRYNAEKADKKDSLKRGRSPMPQAGATGESTRDKIAKEEGVSKNTVERAGARMEIHDAVEEVAPDVAVEVLECPATQLKRIVFAAPANLSHKHNLRLRLFKNTVFCGVDLIAST
jgi:hypothetical protein